MSKTFIFIPYEETAATTEIQIVQSLIAMNVTADRVLGPEIVAAMRERARSRTYTRLVLSPVLKERIRPTLLLFQDSTTINFHKCIKTLLDPAQDMQAPIHYQHGFKIILKLRQPS